jgi:hypothetical protein
VQAHLRAEFDRAPAGDVRLISLCAGQGRDMIGVLTGHPRRDDVRAQIVVACGIFGNITGGDIQATVAALPSLCARGALVLWTRHRRPPDLTPMIRSWFAEAGFREEAFDTSNDGFMSVGVHRLAGEPAALALGQRLFTFHGGTELGPS